MNILFLTTSSSVDIGDPQSIYGSLLSGFVKDGNNVFAVSPTERRNNKKTYLIKDGHYKLLKVRTGNIEKTNAIEKGISTITIGIQFKRAIKKYFKGVKFDLILYVTPTVTFCTVVGYFRKRDNAKTYLMLKDIFPQNAVDLGMFSERSLFYKYFRMKEKKLYKLSDAIGCMSPENRKYLLKHNDYLDERRVEILPNSINPKKENLRKKSLSDKYRKKYNIPLNAKVFIYGGNLGRPQGIDFIINCFKDNKDLKNAFFVVCGAGTEYKKLEEFKNENDIKNLLVLKGLPREEYSEFLNVADVGLIFLDYNFTIPNFPSRLLSYMEK